MPVRDGDGTGNWIEMTVLKRCPESPYGWERTLHNTFFTSLDVHAGNVGEIARAGRARWMVEKCAIPLFSTNVKLAET